jgi:hypothetical protein
MPFSRANRRLTILSIVTCVLAITTMTMYGLGYAEAAKAFLLIFGPVGVIWNNERLASIQRHDLREPMQEVVSNANEAALKAQAAVTVTVETFEKLQNDLNQIKISINGELDQRIIATVDKALDAALDKRMDSLATKIADRIANAPAKVQT